ncbi:glutathione S-transferase family protein [uncultured Methylobacterium sp.]|uniref:glutathione S-transferase family protein n=1 Tax=uncultured Methylobacterium sp. TaxID=157278 RepID=UPI0035CA040B
MSEIRLWYSPGACSLAPHVLLHEIRAPFDAIETSVAKGANLTDDFARLNPKRRVPVLALDGAVITEVPAIATAIANLAPERHLMGRTALDRVRVCEWMNWLSGTLHGQGFGGLWRPQRFSDEPRVFESIKARARTTISECFEVIEHRLTGPHATGDGFTAVDPFLLVFYRWGNGVGLDMPTTYPSYARFAQRLVQRASVATALAAEGIDGQSLRDQVPRPDSAPHTAPSTEEMLS